MIKRILAAAALTLAATSITSGAIAAEGSSDAKAGGAAERVGTAAVSPTVSPAAHNVVYRAGGIGSYDCKSGHLCVDVWDPTRDTYKVFDFYKCQTHALRGFYSTEYPEYENRQTGDDTRTYFERSRGDEYKESDPPHGTRYIDWDPINYIDVC